MNKILIGRTIQKLRKEKCISQTELAFLLDIPSQSKISAWENGNCVPDLLESLQLSKIFNVPITNLLNY